MNKFGLATLSSAAAAALAGAVIALAAPVAAAPTGPTNAEQAIAQLRSEGYKVIVTQIGTAPLDQAQVVSIRPGQTFDRIEAGAPVLGSTDNFVKVQDKTVYVDVK